MPKISPEEWEQRKNSLDLFLLQYQYISTNYIKMFNHWPALLKFDDGSINHAKRRLHISEEYITPPQQTQKYRYESSLTQQDKENILTFLNYGISYEALKEIYNISRSTLYQAVARIKKKGGISTLNIKGCFANGVRGYLELYEKQEKTENESFLINVLEEHLVLPMIKNVENRLYLEKILTPLNGIERLLYKVLDLNPREEVMKELRTIVREEKMSNRYKFAQELIQRMTLKIKRGDYVFYLPEKDKKEILNSLKEKEREVINLRYIEGSKTFEEVGNNWGFKRQWAGYIEGGVIEKIRAYTETHPVTMPLVVKRLEEGLKRKDEIISAIEEMIRSKDYARCLEYLGKEKTDMQKTLFLTELSTRAKNVLEREGILTVEQLAKFFEEAGVNLMKRKGLGIKTYEEIEAFLKRAQTVK